MTTKITTIRNALVSAVASALATDYQRIPNPYSAGDNNALILNKGYGVAIGPGQKVDLEVCNMSIDRTFNVILVRVAAASEHDITTRDSIEAALCEDIQAIRLELERNSNTLSGNAVRTDYLGDSGIEFLVNPDSGFKYYSTNISVSVLYQESYGG